MNLIFEGWRGFLTEQNAQATLDRVEKIAELRGIEGGSYRYENGKLNGIKLTKEEIKYINDKLEEQALFEKVTIIKVKDFVVN